MGILSEHLARQAKSRDDKAAQALVSGLLGQAPTEGGELGAGGFGPPAPAGLGGSGLLADLNDPNRQATFAAGLLGQTATRGVGGQLLGGVFADQGAMDRLKVSNIAAMDRSILGQSTSLANAALQRQQTAGQFERTFQQSAETERLKRLDKQRQGLLPAPASGFARVPAPVTQDNPFGFRDVMVPGGVPFKQAQGAAIETRQGAELVDELLSMVIDSEGPEAFGERAGKARGIQGQLLSAVLQSRGFGAPQAAEMEFLFRQIPDISELTSGVGWGKKGELIGALMQLRAEFEASFKVQQTLGEGSNIPELSRDFGPSPTQVAERAAALGLTQVPRSEFEQRGVLGEGVPESSPARARFRRP